MKRCSDCRRMKPLSEFYKETYVHKIGPRGGDGHRPDCKKCLNKKNRDNWLKRGEDFRKNYMREYMKKYRAKNK